MSIPKLFFVLFGIFSIAFSLDCRLSHAEENPTLAVRPIFRLEGFRVDFSFSPRMIAVDRNHNEIYVVDSSGKNVSIFDAKGRYLFWFSLRSSPLGLGVSKNGDIYVAELENILVLNYRGVFKKKLDLSVIPDYKSLKIQSMHLGKDNRIYIGDGVNGRVIILDMEGKFLYQFGEKGKKGGKINNIHKLATDEERVYILDPPLFKISIFDKKGKFISRFGLISGLAGGFSMPVGLVADGKRIYVADVNRMMAMVFDRDGTFLFEFGGDEFGEAFLWPGDINVDNDGNIYVADAGHKMVRVFEVIPEEEKEKEKEEEIEIKE